jgi:hypothetical protein
MPKRNGSISYTSQQDPNPENLEEQPERGFCGTWASRELHDLVEAGTLSITAAWLAMVIYSLSRGSRGCFASNAYLGGKIHKSPRRVQELLESLEKCGLLEARWDGDRRFLRVLPTGGAKQRRVEAYVKTNRPARCAENRASDARKTARQGGPPPYTLYKRSVQAGPSPAGTPVDERPGVVGRTVYDDDEGLPGSPVNGANEHKNSHTKNGDGQTLENSASGADTEQKNSHTKNGHRQSPGSSANGASPVWNGHNRITWPDKKPKAQRRPRDEHYRASQKLKDALRDSGRAPQFGAAWDGRHLKELAEKHGQDYQPVLDWYCRHCGKADREKFGLPSSVASEYAFCQRYSWIEDCREKDPKHAPRRYRTDSVMDGPCAILRDDEII